MSAEGNSLPEFIGTRMRRIMDAVEMPDRVAADLLLFIRQNKGPLPKSRREREFAALTDKEVEQTEAIVREAFEGFEEAR